jgi:acetyltransferase-like isoleucine patch superfamily enzyme/glycosyltransferase involved in cell wall biosynthesis
LPQLQEGVELLVCDNASIDGTADYLKTHVGKLTHHRHAENIGGEANFYSCISLSKGQYTWILCDDDLPCSNAVEQILRARKEAGEPGLIYLRAKPGDQCVSDYNPQPVQSDWRAMDRDTFLTDIGVWVTFGSSIVVRRDCVDKDFIKLQFSTNLVLAAIALQAAGSTNSIMVSERPLLFVRGGNAGGYNAYTVFTKNFHRLLTECRAFGYKQTALNAAYDSSLTQVLPYLIQVWPITIRGFFNLVWYSWTFPAFYRRVLPGLVRKAGKYVCRMPFRACWYLTKRMVQLYASRFGAELYSLVQEQLDKAAVKNFKARVADAGPNAFVRHPLYLKNPKYFQIGRNFRAEPGLRMEAWDSFAGQRFHPLVSIGNNVCINWNLHLGAINRIEIHDNVLIGSNVLITDHSHGQLNSEENEQPPCLRPLTSKGPVVIEENVWIGEGVCILPGVRIGRGAVIGANAVVTSDVAPGSVVAGIPARKLNRVRTIRITDT